MTLLAATLVVACDEGDPMVDGGPGVDAGPGEDAGPGVDAGPGEDAGPPADGGPDVDAGPEEVSVLRRPSRSSTLDISPDDSRVAMVNPGDGSLSVFTTADNARVSRTATGARPSAVVIHPNGTSAFVANQADATVVRVDGIDGAAPSVSAPTEVGSEPTGLALSPTGALLFVAEWGESRVSVIDTATMTVTSSFPVPSPYALAVTNDGDEDDDDESLVIPEFFGRPNENGEANDAGRTGFVHVRPLTDLGTETTPITLAPVESGFGEPSDMTSPNQLFGITIVGSRAYITSISASPAAPVASNRNVHPVVYVVNLATGAEDRSPTGHANLARLVRDQISVPADRNFLGDIVGTAFVGNDIAYVLSRAGDTVQRLDYSGATITIGSAMNDQIDVFPPPGGASSGCRTPTGIVTTHASPPRAYLNCWVSRNLGVVELASQSLTTVVESTSPPSGIEAISIDRGLRFFFTGRGRWSDQSWSSCASCHPGGLTDNITWAFAAGPRQSTSLDGSYSHGSGAQVQRIFNWSGIFDEMHDFERNTRGVQGGLGAITEASDGSDCAAGETRIDISGAAPVGIPMKELQDAGCTRDWDDIDAWARTIRPPRARRGLDPAAVARGAALFGAGQGNCVQCHGGAGWTASRRFWTPSTANNAALTTTAFAPPVAWPASWNQHTFQIQTDQPGGAPPPHVACVLRNIGTFGVRNTDGSLDGTASDILEVRDNGGAAQGIGGYNIPSLYGLQLGAPFLHHGQAPSLEALLDNRGPWRAHLQSGNAVFLEDDGDGSQLADLITFLLSIDASTAEQAIPTGFDGCPVSFP